MMPWFVWKGKNSLGDFGLWISKLPERVRPQERKASLTIPGRAGTLTLLEGEDVYDAYSADMTVVGRNSLPYDKIIEWLRGTSDLILCTDTGKARRARIAGEVRFARLGNNLMQAKIPFEFQPFRASVHPENDKVTISGTGTLFNPGDVASYPIVYMSGGSSVTIAGKTLTLGGSGTVMIDCAARMATQSGQIFTGSMSGEFFCIPVGSSSVTGSCEILPEWRWL